MKNPDSITTSNEQIVSASEIRTIVADLYTKSPDLIQVRGHELITIFTKELKANFLLEDIMASPYWHAMTMSGEKKLSYTPDMTQVRNINTLIEQFILQKIQPLIKPETITQSSDLLTSITELKTKIFNLGDIGLGEHYQFEVNALVLELQKDYPFSLTKIPEIDAVIGGSGNYDSLSDIDSQELADVRERFKTLYEPIHSKFSKYLDRT